MKQVGLRGEAMNLISPSEASSDDWIKGSLAKQNKQPLTWYKVILMNSEQRKHQTEKKNK